MGLVATVEPGISAFDTLLQNGAERQAGYERPLSPLRPCMPRRTLLSPEQRARLFAVPTTPAEMARHYVLSAKDLMLVRAKRRTVNRLGFAVQLCLLRHPGQGHGEQTGLIHGGYERPTHRCRRGARERAPHFVLGLGCWPRPRQVNGAFQRISRAWSSLHQAVRADRLLAAPLSERERRETCSAMRWSLTNSSASSFCRRGSAGPGRWHALSRMAASVSP